MNAGFGTRVRQAFSRLRAEVADESGIALPTVVAMSVILFMLATVLLILSASLVYATRSQSAVVKATHMADAGLNAYLYQLRRDPTFYETQPGLGPTVLEDGAWTVTTDPPSTPGAPVVVHALGSIPSMQTTASVTAAVRFPTYADFMFLSNAEINIGADAVIDGRVRSNGNVVNSGRVKGRVIAAGSVSGSGRFDDGWDAGQPKVDFSQVTSDMNLMQGYAVAAGTYFTGSGGLGYRAVIVGDKVHISRVKSGTGTGNLVTELMAVVAIPSEGVFYFNEDVWVSGTYSAKITIACSRDIYIDDNLQPANMRSTATCGLIAEKSIVVPTWYPTLPNNMTLTAAMLARTGNIYGDLVNGQTKAKITITGSMAYFTYGYFARYSGATVTAGFRARDYNYDQRLEVEPPPHYPRLRDGSLKVTTWFED